MWIMWIPHTHTHTHAHAHNRNPYDPYDADGRKGKTKENKQHTHSTCSVLCSKRWGQKKQANKKVLPVGLHHTASLLPLEQSLIGSDRGAGGNMGERAETEMNKGEEDAGAGHSRLPVPSLHVLTAPPPWQKIHS